MIQAIVWQKVRGWARFNHLVRKSVAEKRSLRRVARFIRVYGLYILEIREIGGLASLRMKFFVIRWPLYVGPYLIIG